MSVWIFSGCSSFLLPPKDGHVRFIGMSTCSSLRDEGEGGNERETERERERERLVIEEHPVKGWFLLAL